MVWPSYFKDRLDIGNLNSTTAICCLWTPKEYVKQLVSQESYCVLGQLYTKKGINYILRNIFLNPSIKRIILVGEDLMKSGETLIKLSQKGVNSDNHIADDTSFSLDLEISKEYIYLFRKNVEIVDFRGSKNLANLAEFLKSYQKENSKPKLWAKPIDFPQSKEAEIQTFPSEVGVFKITALTMGAAYPQVLKHIMEFGFTTDTVINYATNTSKLLKEVLNMTVVISPNPELEEDFRVFPFSKEDLDSYIKGFLDPDPKTEDYTYGERLFNYGEGQIEQLKDIYPWLKIERFKTLFPFKGFDQVSGGIIRKLSKFPCDRGAVALLGNVFTDVFPQRPPKKIPCLFLIQCQVLDNKLNLTAYFRSNDMYNAWPLNCFALKHLQKDIASKLSVKVGSLITISNMAHIYEHNWQDAVKIIEKNCLGVCEWDARGNFIVSTNLKSKKLEVCLISPDGNVQLRKWEIDGLSPNASRNICYRIETDLGVSTIGNAMYLGRQVERAVSSLLLNIEYKQDQPLQLTR